MATIIGLSGSLRRGSFNTMLLRAAGERLPPGTTLEIASIRDIPLYDADLDAAGPLPQVVALKDRIAAFVTLPLAVSPRTPASVLATVSSTCGGNCSPIGLPLNF